MTLRSPPLPALSALPINGHSEAVGAGVVRALTLSIADALYAHAVTGSAFATRLALGGILALPLPRQGMTEPVGRVRTGKGAGTSGRSRQDPRPSTRHQYHRSPTLGSPRDRCPRLPRTRVL